MRHPEAQLLIEKLGLLPHPEGGFYRETYRSEHQLEQQDRSLMTSIYFLLTDTNISRFHRITADECWYFHAGTPIIVHTLDEKGHHEFILGNDVSKGQLPYYLVKGGTIFGSSMLGDDGYALVSCAVAPGFDFRDFELFDTETLLGQLPQHEAIIRKMTSTENN
ncbi:MAG TPA: cupin domain-containing protein [Fluviicola sp.]|nr:cupin domain-containing protein [Fluviicola sp.]